MWKKCLTKEIMLANFLNKSKPIIFIGTLILFFCVLTVTLIFGSYTAKTFSSIILETIVFVFFFLFILNWYVPD